jgi:zinc protease
LILPGGHWRDEPDRTGAASLLAALSMQGTARRTPAELEEAIGMLGATIHFSAGKDDLKVDVTALGRNLEETVALVEEMLLEPRWDVAEFERLRAAATARIVAAQGDAEDIAARVWNRLAYGDEHPYGRRLGGSLESLAAMTIDDLKAWHAAHLAPAGSRLQVVGAVDADRIEAAFSGIAKRWRGDPVAQPEFALQAPSQGRAVYFVDMPGAKQSVLRVGKRAVFSNDPDWTRLRFANQELGGGASGRLMQMLRIEKGFTYGAYSGLGNLKNAVSPWSASTSVRANVTLESMQLMREQISKYAATFSDEDAAVTRELITKRNARAFETLDAKLGLLNRIAMYGLPLDIVEKESATLQEMSTADYRRVITDHLDESEMIWVVVGDGATQRDRLKDFGYGDPIEVDIDGNRLIVSPK